MRAGTRTRSRFCWTGTSGRSRSGAVRPWPPCTQSGDGSSAPPAVGYRLGERPVADHVLHGQVLDHDHVMVADQAGRGAVQEIGPAGADLAVGAGGLRLSLPPVRDPSAAGEPALVPGQVPRPPFQPPRVQYLLSPEVTAKSFMPRSTPTTAPVAGSWHGIGYVHGEGSTSARTGPGDCHRGGSISAGSTSGRPGSSVVLIWPRNRSPLRYRNPERVYSAVCRPLRELYRGYRARPGKLLNAACWCRIAC